MLIYGGIAAFGVLLLLLMLVVGELFGGDHDTSHDVGHGDGGGPSVFSARIIAAFFAAFGVGGVVARYYDLSHPAASGVGVVCGVAMASVVFQFAKVLYGQQASSEVQMSGLVGTSAHVTVAIPAIGVGQIALTTAGQMTEHIARSANGQPIARGTEVVVTATKGDAVLVLPAGMAAGGGAL